MSKEIYFNLVKNYPVYFKVFKSIKKSFHINYLIYLNFDDDNFFKCIATDKNDKKDRIILY